MGTGLKAAGMGWGWKESLRGRAGIWKKLCGCGAGTDRSYATTGWG